MSDPKLHAFHAQARNFHLAYQQCAAAGQEFCSAAEDDSRWGQFEAAFHKATELEGEAESSLLAAWDNGFDEVDVIQIGDADGTVYTRYTDTDGKRLIVEAAVHEIPSLEDDPLTLTQADVVDEDEEAEPPVEEHEDDPFSENFRPTPELSRREAFRLLEAWKAKDPQRVFAFSPPQLGDPSYRLLMVASGYTDFSYDVRTFGSCPLAAAIAGLDRWKELHAKNKKDEPAEDKGRTVDVCDRDGWRKVAVGDITFTVDFDPLTDAEVEKIQAAFRPSSAPPTELHPSDPKRTKTAAEAAEEKDGPDGKACVRLSINAPSGRSYTATATNFAWAAFDAIEQWDKTPAATVPQVELPAHGCTGSIPLPAPANAEGSVQWAARKVHERLEARNAAEDGSEPPKTY